MKHPRLSSLASLIIVVAASALTGCGGGDSLGQGSDNGGPPMAVAADGTSTFDSTNLGAALAATAVEPLNDAERQSVTYMREEEKLAGDVYRQLNTQWGLTIFANIGASESTHTEAVRQLIVRYQLADPAGSLAAGSFANPTLQALYTQLVATGRGSLVEALKVGAAIEELDMLDITNQLAGVDNQDIRLVYDNLLKGSRNHLRAFYRSLQQQGGSYTAQYLPKADFDAIVNTTFER